MLTITLKVRLKRFRHNGREREWNAAKGFAFRLFAFRRFCVRRARFFSLLHGVGCFAGATLFVYQDFYRQPSTVYEGSVSGVRLYCRCEIPGLKSEFSAFFRGVRFCGSSIFFLIFFDRDIIISKKRSLA